MRGALFAISLASLLLTACAAPRPQMSRDEWLKLATHHYDNVTPNQALEAAEKLLRLADGDDFRIVHYQDRMVATRNWGAYMVITAVNGVDHWVVHAVPAVNGTDMSVEHGRAASAIAPVPTASGRDVSVTALPVGSAPPYGRALYDLFWARMDYLLGKSDKWITCQEADRMVSEGHTWGMNEALCSGFNITDTDPRTGRGTYADAQKASEGNQIGRSTSILQP